jgi:hypothetical protein
MRMYAHYVIRRVIAMSTSNYQDSIHSARSTIGRGPDANDPRLYESFGPRRLMWGSDAPFQIERPHSHAGSLELVRDRLDLLNVDDGDGYLGKRLTSCSSLIP